MDEELKKHVLKTGTTTVGIVCKDGIILAADRRASYGGEGGVAYIAGDHEKVHKVNDEIIVTTAGVASDTRKVIKLIRAELKLKELRTKNETSVKEAANLFSTIVYQNIRQFSPIMAITNFLLAGHDSRGFYLFNISPDGFLEEVKKYEATGSGMMQSHPILDAEYKDGMTLEEGAKLAKKCINASRKRDPASGDGIDIYTITKNEIKQVLNQVLVPEFKDRN
jgi:proteasome beta subunit